MTVQCIACSRFNLRSAGNMARHGAGNCTGRPAWEFYGAEAERECARHDPAKPEVVEARRAWFAKKGGSE